MNELVVISGKGGSGKTTIAASLAALAAGTAVLADADVDAADLHLVLKPRRRSSEDFQAGWEPSIDPALCYGCGQCRRLCRFDAISQTGTSRRRSSFWPARDAAFAADHCPTGAITLVERRCGMLMVSDTPYGPLVHARLLPGTENTGKLVAAVRRRARAIAEQTGRSLILTDGPPGIGCPVISSLTGATAVLIVAEPTVSGLHDLERVLRLSLHFEIPSFICITKADLNVEVAGRIRRLAERFAAPVLTSIDYDPSANRAQIEARPLVELSDTRAGRQIEQLWNRAPAPGDARSFRPARRSADRFAVNRKGFFSNQNYSRFLFFFRRNHHAYRRSLFRRKTLPALRSQQSIRRGGRGRLQSTRPIDRVCDPAGPRAGRAAPLAGRAADRTGHCRRHGTPGPRPLHQHAIETLVGAPDRSGPSNWPSPI